MDMITRGAIIPDAGNSVENKTGSWRVFKPIIHYEKCIRCFICWQYCPEPAIYKKDGSEYPAKNDAIKKRITEVPVIDYDYCKGCGICYEECPVNAIEFVKEEK